MVYDGFMDSEIQLLVQKQRKLSKIKTVGTLYKETTRCAAKTSGRSSIQKLRTKNVDCTNMYNIDNMETDMQKILCMKKMQK